MEEEEEAAEVEDLAPRRLHSCLLEADAAAEEVFLSLPQLQEEEMPGALSDLHQRMMLNRRDHVDHAELFLLVLFVHRDFHDMGFFHFGHSC